MLPGRNGKQLIGPQDERPVVSIAKPAQARRPYDAAPPSRSHTNFQILLPAVSFVNDSGVTGTKTAAARCERAERARIGSVITQEAAPSVHESRQDLCRRRTSLRA
jgi:hypothetical protein